MMSILRRVICEGVGRKFSSRSRKLSGGAPWLMLPPSFRGDGEMVYNLYSPSKEEGVSLKGKGGKEEAELMRDEKTIVVGSSHGWLALLNEGSGDMLLSNPVSGERVKLPPFWPLTYEEELHVGLWKKRFKVILSCSPNEQGCRALIIPSSLPAVSVLDRVAFCCPGCSDVWWAPIKSSNDCTYYVDYVYSAARRRFYGCVQAESADSADSGDRYLQSWSWDMMSDFNPRITDLPAIDMFGQDYLDSLCTYLVSAVDQLFIVRLNTPHSSMRELDFDVFTTNESGGLQLCSSLDGLVMFVGNISHSVALPASQFPDLKPNSIYYSEEIVGESGSRFIGIFDYENRSWSPCYYPPGIQLQKFESPSSLPWFTPTLD